MPLVNVIRGERIEPAPLNLRTPFVRVPLWLALSWWCAKGMGRLVVLAARHWYVTAPAGVLGWLYLRYGWAGPALLVGGLGATGAGWAFGHRSSFARWAGYPLLSRYRRMVYRRRWHAAMATAKLVVSFGAGTVLPVLKRVRCTSVGDVLTVRMVTGQIADDYAAAGERLATTFGVLGAKVMPGRKPELVTIVMRRHDALRRPVSPLPVPAVPDFTALPVGMTEDGAMYALRLFGTQVLVVGATGAGKGSVIWSIIRAMAAGVRSGLVEVWAFDPKGGMELGGGRSLFARFLRQHYEAMADALEEAVEIAQRRADRLCGVTRQHVPQPGDPLIVIVIDELAALTSYADRKLKDRIKQALGMLLTQGRAVGVHVVAALQDPRKETLPDRNLFPTRIALRLSEESEVEMVFGKGARDRGALCDRILLSSPGVGFVMLEGDPTPMRVRFSYLDDDEIRHMARTYGRLRVVNREALDGAA